MSWSITCRSASCRSGVTPKRRPSGATTCSGSSTRGRPSRTTSSITARSWTRSPASSARWSLTSNAVSSTRRPARSSPSPTTGPPARSITGSICGTRCSPGCARRPGTTSAGREQRSRPGGIPSDSGSPPISTPIGRSTRLMHCYGSAIQDEDANLAINTPATVEAVKVCAEIYRTGMTDEVFAWDASSNNRLLTSGRGSLILNAVSAVRAAEQQDPELASKIALAPVPIGSAGDRPRCTYVLGSYVIWKFASQHRTGQAVPRRPVPGLPRRLPAVRLLQPARLPRRRARSGRARGQGPVGPSAGQVRPPGRRRQLVDQRRQPRRLQRRRRRGRQRSSSSPRCSPPPPGARSRRPTPSPPPRPRCGRSSTSGGSGGRSDGPAGVPPVGRWRGGNSVSRVAARVTGSRTGNAATKESGPGGGDRTLRIANLSHYVRDYNTWFDQEFCRRWGEDHDVDVVVDHIPYARAVRRGPAPRWPPARATTSSGSSHRRRVSRTP